MIIRGCEGTDQAALLAQSVQRSHTLTTPTEVGPLVTSVRWVRDARLLQAVLDLAQDRSAAPVPRVYAFMGLAMLLDDRAEAEYSNFTLGLDAVGEVARTPCTASRLEPIHEFITGAQPLPADFRAQIRAAARRVHGDASEPTVVRGAAACTHGGYLKAPPA